MSRLPLKTFEVITISCRIASSADPSFEDSREQIEKLLVEQRVLEALDQWLAMAVARRTSVIARRRLNELV